MQYERKTAVIIGWTKEGMPILQEDPERKAFLAWYDSLPKPAYKGRSLTAEELDEECTRVEQARERDMG